MKEQERAETALQHPATVETPADNHPLLFPIYQNVKWETETVAETLRVHSGERPGSFDARAAKTTVRQPGPLMASLPVR